MADSGTNRAAISDDGLQRALPLAQALIRCPSVTPVDAGALDLLGGWLERLGFACHRLRFEAPDTAPVENLYARIGTAAPNFCFAGHTDVVPVGDAAAWSVDPFAGLVREGRLWGRGAADMKGAIACFVAATARYLSGGAGLPDGSISLLITGDEEGPAINGTRRVLDWLGERGETLDACLVGEPTNPHVLGEMMKIGRRGSLNAWLTVCGRQGHAAYPHLADNPIPRLIRMLKAIDETPLDDGSAHFPPSHVSITSIDVGNPATNVIPAKARATLNVRFNDHHTGAGIARWIEDRCRSIADGFEVRSECSGEAFLTAPGPLTELVAAAVARVIGRAPEASTSGGTSDARFIKDFCPVVEFGMVGATAHQVDEHVAIAELETLTEVYRAVLATYFAR